MKRSQLLSYSHEKCLIKTKTISISINSIEFYVGLLQTFLMGVFDVAQSVVNSAAGSISSNTAIDINAVVTSLETRLKEMDIGPLFGMWFQSMLMGIITWVLTICIFIVVYGRMIEIYMVTSVAPIPMASMMNREWG